ncbi:MAG: Xaa-Pro peptidase family protein [Phycisphaerae bacterium]
MERIHRLKEHLVKNGIDLVILNQNSDLYYYTGSVQPLYLVVPATSEAFVLARKAIHRVREESRVKLETFSNSKDLTEIFQRHGIASAKRVGFTLDLTSYATVTRFQRLLGTHEIVDISWDIRTLRMVKSKSEIALQTQAGAIMSQVPQIIKSSFRPGMTELELTAALENYFRLNGHGAMVRCRREGTEMAGFGVCSAGVNSLSGTKFDGVCCGKGISPANPTGASRDPIAKCVPVILDYTFVLEGYHIDQTRMFSWGTPSDEVLKAYNAMVKIEHTIINSLKPGRLWEDIYTDALNLAADLGYTEGFMGLNPEKVKFIGHGVGLELDEPPYLAPQMKYPLAQGMVLAIEPKVALPNIGVIGIEDTVVIDDHGTKCLTICPAEFLMVQ